MGAKSAPHGPADRGRGHTAPPRRAVEVEGEESEDSVSSRVSGFLFMWKIKRQELNAFLLVVHGEF